MKRIEGIVASNYCRVLYLSSPVRELVIRLLALLRMTLTMYAECREHAGIDLIPAYE
jgi:hypothetical protein